jgi:hypothetical protein
MARRLSAVEAATLIIIATMALPVTAAATENITGVPSVIDGDTIDPLFPR